MGNLVTNGPFQLEAWVPSQHIILSRNPQYHGSFPGNVDRVELRLMGFSPEAGGKSLAMYEKGELDAWWINLPEGDEARQKHRAEYITRPWPML